jgi:hypothetical protein
MVQRRERWDVKINLIQRMKKEEKGIKVKGGVEERKHDKELSDKGRTKKNEPGERRRGRIVFHGPTRSSINPVGQLKSAV